MSSPDYPAVAVLGPTASGKTVVGIALAEHSRGEIVCCDAMQVYRHMDIGTAKPTAEQRRKVPHHMLDLREPDEDFSAGDYQRLAREALVEIRGRDRIPFVVGGTGFYFRALTEGLFAGPGRSNALRTRLRKIAAARGSGSLHRLLSRSDPDTAARLPAADIERIIRAVEILILTGRPMSWWQSKPRDALRGFRWLKLGIEWPRPMLYERIDRRVDEMFGEGFVDEVRALLGRFPADCQAFKAIGYRQIIRHLEGASTLAQAVEETQRESRRYAKRQLTWFRADPDIIWMNAGAGEEAVVATAAEHVKIHLEWE